MLNDGSVYGPAVPVPLNALLMLRSNLREGTAGTRAGPSPKSARGQSQELLGQCTAASEIPTGFPAFNLGGGKGRQATFAVAPTLFQDEK